MVAPLIPLLFFLVPFTLSQISVSSWGAESDEAVSRATNLSRDLSAKLADGYDRHLRPQLSRRLDVRNEFIIYSMVEIDEAKESVKLMLWIAETWIDQRLAWDPAEYPGIEVLHLAAEDIWLPDGHIFNSIDFKDSMPLANIMARVAYNGTVSADFYKLIDFHCPMNVQNFPFDEQNCTLVFGSWAYGATDLKFEPVAAIIANRSSEWHFVSFTAQSILNPAHGTLYQECHYTLRIQRKPEWQVCAFILPTYAIVFLSIVGLFVPTQAGKERGEKVTIGLTSFLTLTIMLQMLLADMPKSSTGFPSIGYYFIEEGVVMAVGVLVSVAILCFDEYSTGRRPPSYIQRFFGEKPGRKATKKDPQSAPSFWKRPSTSDEDDNLCPVAEQNSVVSKFIADKIRTSSYDGMWSKLLFRHDLFACLALLLAHTWLTYHHFWPQIASVYW